jgi:enoyl-[acyl-carrier protein] reductase III
MPKHALITGSSRGIGRGIALKLAAEGTHVAIHYYRNEAAANDTLSAIRSAGADGFVMQGDVCNPADVSRMIGEVKSRFGKVDIFVANARPEASEFFYPPMEISTAQWDSAMESQAKAFLIGAREAAAIMPDGGRMIAITYTAGVRTGGMLPWVAMGCAKAALESLVRYFAVALAPRGITVNAISPGWTEDSVLNSLPAEVQGLIRNWHSRGWTPMRRLGTPDDVGDTVALFCSEKARWITGQVIAADGGSSLMSPEMPTEMQIG